jgi:uncharacterized membrane protein YcaP (DUF421 family)
MYVALFVTLRIVGRRQSGRFGTADLLVIVFALAPQARCSPTP